MNLPLQEKIEGSLLARFFNFFCKYYMKNGTFKPDIPLSSLTTQKAGPSHWVELAVLMLILLCAFLLRVIYPDLYMTGFDMPGHIMASMRLHQTSLFEVDNLLRNTFVQTLFYNHGYTTILLPWILYELVFNFLGLGITEARLVYLNSLIGMLSLLSIYFFVRVNFNLKIASLVLLTAIVAPIHIGLSRTHVGSQVVSSIFFYAGLGILSLYLSQKKIIWKYLYFASVFLYIGSDNAFFVGLILQIFFAFSLLQSQSIRDRFTFLRKLYFSLPALLSIGLPVGLYIATTLIGFRLGLDGGFLFRLANKVYKQAFVLDLLKSPNLDAKTVRTSRVDVLGCRLHQSKELQEGSFGYENGLLVDQLPRVFFYTQSEHEDRI